MSTEIEMATAPALRIGIISIEGAGLRGQSSSIGRKEEEGCARTRHDQAPDE